jgi:hypothetical protein
VRLPTGAVKENALSADSGTTSTAQAASQDTSHDSATSEIATRASYLRPRLLKAVFEYQSANKQKATRQDIVKIINGAAEPEGVNTRRAH